MANQLKDLLDDNSKVFTPESIDQLVREAAHGNIQAVKDLLSKNPNVGIKRLDGEIFFDHLFLPFLADRSKELGKNSSSSKLSSRSCRHC